MGCVSSAAVYDEPESEPQVVAVGSVTNVANPVAKSQVKKMVAVAESRFKRRVATLEIIDSAQLQALNQQIVEAKDRQWNRKANRCRIAINRLKHERSAREFIDSLTNHELNMLANRGLFDLTSRQSFSRMKQLPALHKLIYREAAVEQRRRQVRDMEASGVNFYEIIDARSQRKIDAKAAEGAATLLSPTNLFAIDEDLEIGCQDFDAWLKREKVFARGRFDAEQDDYVGQPQWPCEIPGISFHCRHAEPRQDVTPGPYCVPDCWRDGGPSWSLRIRPGSLRQDCTPGPGAYDLPDVISTGPKFTIKSRHGKTGQDRWTVEGLPDGEEKLAPKQIRAKLVRGRRAELEKLQAAFTGKRRDDE